MRAAGMAVLAAAAFACLAASPRVARAAETDTTSAQGAGPDVVVNEFMSYNPGTKKVKLKLFAALGSDNGGMNFNGGSRGKLTITVPEGWAVHVDFQNKDAIPHSAIVLADKMPFPMAPDRPAISRAYTKDLTAGIPTDGTDTMDFTASPAAKYLIVCGVPGHGPSGMYITFVVSATAKVPEYLK